MGGTEEYMKINTKTVIVLKIILGHAYQIMCPCNVCASGTFYGMQCMCVLSV